MTPFAAGNPQHISASRKGGRANTPKKRAALKKLHSARRGVRTNKLGISEHEYRGLLADLTALLREPVRGRISIRVLAHHCRVDDKSVRRWLDGTCWPTSVTIRKIQAWMRSVG
jgi:hypothetical protein